MDNWQMIELFFSGFIAGMWFSILILMCLVHIKEKQIEDNNRDDRDSGS